MFAKRYLEKNNNEALIQHPPSSETGMSIIIPCFREPNITDTLHSIRLCNPPVSHVEVLILINHAENAADDVRRQNSATRREIEDWILANQTEKITFYAIGPVELKKKWAGAGLARKKGWTKPSGVSTY